MKKILLLLLAAASLNATPQAVVFDFGGVLTRGPHWEVIIGFLRDSFQLSETEFESINQEKRKAVQSGKSDEEFWRSFAKEKNITLPDNWSKSFASAMKQAIGINEEMYTLVKELKEKKIPVGLLSNIDESLAKRLRVFGLYEPFEPCLLSCQIGARKPDPKAYQILLEHFALTPQDIVFIDDKIENVQQANEMGIDAILFESTDQIRQELYNRDLL